MYRWNAKEYEKYSSGQQKWAGELIAKLEPKGDEALLDIGCGDGRVTAEIASLLRDGFVTGIDYSLDMVDLARSKYTGDRYSNLRFLNLDARELSFNEEFDIVFSNAALHWVIDHRAVLKGIFQALKPAGRMLLQMGGRGNGREVFRLLESFENGGKWSGYLKGVSFPYGFYGPEEYACWMKEAGFEARRIELIPKNMVHESLDKFKGWIRTTWLPYTQRIPEGRRELFIDDLASGYTACYPPDDRGRIHLDMVRLEVEAVKPG